MQKREEWRSIEGFAGYAVSSEGRVRSEDRVVVEKTGMEKQLKGRVLRSRTNRGGYSWASLSVGGIVRQVRLHRVVALAFIGEQPSAGYEVAHKDGNRSNNRPSNLRWDTRAGNFADKVAHGTHNRGERHPNCRLSSAAIAAIRASSASHAALATEYGTTVDYVQKVRANKKRRYE